MSLKINEEKKNASWLNISSKLRVPNTRRVHDAKFKINARSVKLRKCGVYRQVQVNLKHFSKRFKKI